MLLYEFTDNEHPVESVLALLNLIKTRYEGKQATPKINTISFLHLAKNVGLTLDYATFAEMYEQHSALKNIVKNFNKNFITLVQSDEIDSEHSGPEKKDTDADTVSAMAKQAVKI